jgi:hypothetical protein
MLLNRLRVGALCLAGTLLVAGGCSDAPAAPRSDSGLALEKLARHVAPARSVDGAAAAKVIGPQGGELVTPAGHRLVFPVGALAHPTEIRMTDDPSYVGVRLQPHGLRFPAGRSPVLTLGFPDGTFRSYDFLRIVYVDDASEILEVLPTRVDGTTVTAHLRHFSGYLIGGGRQE